MLDVDSRRADQPPSRRWRRPLLGRQAEVAAVRAALRPGALVSITGLGGVGKTSVALEALDDPTAASPAFVVDLAAVASARDVPAVLASRVSGFPATARDTIEAVATVLAGRHAVLLLDNVEHLDLRVALHGLRSHAPGLAILVTSRVRLGLDDEHEIPLGPLPTRADTAGEPASAVALFDLVASGHGRGGRHDPDDADLVSAICERLGGLPLAIELCAGWTSILTPSAILRRLEAGTLPLEDLGREGRQASLDEILESTLAVLDDRDRVAFGALASFAGPFDQLAASAVAGQPEPADSLRTIRRLADVALVRTMTGPDGEPWFDIPAALRPIAAKHRDIETDRVLRLRHARHHVEEARSACDGFRRGATLQSIEWFDRHDADLRTATDWAMAADPELGVALVVAQAHWWRLIYRLDDGDARISAALGVVGDVDHGSVAILKTELAWIRMLAGQLDGIDPLTAGAIAAAEAAGRPDLEAEARIARAVCARPVDGPRLLEQAVTLADQAGHAVIGAKARVNLGIEYSRRGRSADSLAAFEAAVRSASATGDRLLQVRALENLGMELLVAHRASDALGVLDRAVDLETALGPGSARPSVRGFRAIANAMVGAIARALDDLAQARSRLPDWSPDEVQRHLETAAIVLSTVTPELAARCLGAAGWTNDAPADGRPRQALLDEAAVRVGQSVGEVRLALALRDGRVAGPPTILSELRAVPRAAVPAGRRGPFGQLTRREEEVLSLLGRGATDIEIGAALYISPKTVSVHISNLKAKLGVRTRVEAALQAQGSSGALPRPGGP